MPTMEEYSINELGGLITVCAGALATVLFALQKSSCTEISFCGCHCKRDPKLIKKNINPEAETPRPAPELETKKTPTRP